MTDGGQILLALLDSRAAGVGIERADTTCHWPTGDVVVDGAFVSDRMILPNSDDTVLETLRETAIIGLCALQLGVTQEAVAKAVAYTSARVVFGRAVGAFQGVALRMADAYIDVEAIRFTMWRAAGNLASARPTRAETAVAKWWAAEGGHRVVHTVQHVHGGIGSDTSYPIHRYFLWGKQLGLMMGGGSAQLADLGVEIASAASASRDANDSSPSDDSATSELTR
jgi:hypothetical protein